MRIAHTVGPVYSKRNAEQAEEQLQNCYRTSLEGCQTLGGGSIGFSSISTGICMFSSLAVGTALQLMRCYEQMDIQLLMLLM